ncbi:MAG: response regulator, partial [Desulfobulbaceae bacterium]|nr:response regulator [Desulfobulbaceae bacterium]
DCWLYLLISGSLTIIKEGQTIGSLRRCGDMFGEMGIIDGSPRSASIIAHSKSALIGFDASIIDQKLQECNISFCHLIYRVFSEILAVRLRETTKQNVTLKKENKIFKEQLTLLRSRDSKKTLSSQLKLEHLSQKKILIVDSIESRRKILRSLLRELKFKDILEVADGENAPESLIRHKINIIIADFNLQKMSGLDLLRKIRSTHTLATTSFVLAINEGDKEKNEMTAEEMNQCLTKPYNANMLYEKLSSVLS